MLNERLVKLRKDRGITQDEMAEKLGVKRQTYGAYERNVSTPDIQTLIKLADIFGVPLDYLLGRSNSKVGNDDNTLRATGLSDESLSALIQNIRDKDTMNKIISHDNFSLIMNLVSLYVTTDVRSLIAHINNDDENKLHLNEPEHSLLNAYNASHVQGADKANKRLPPALNAETVLFLRILTLHDTSEQFDTLFLSVLDDLFNKFITEIRDLFDDDRYGCT